MFGAMGNTEVVEDCSGFQRLCTNWRRLAAGTTSVFQWSLTTKITFPILVRLVEGRETENRTQLQSWLATAFSPSWALPSSRSPLHSASCGKEQRIHFWKLDKDQTRGRSHSVGHLPVPGHMGQENVPKERQELPVVPSQETILPAFTWGTNHALVRL